MEVLILKITIFELKIWLGGLQFIRHCKRKNISETKDKNYLSGSMERKKKFIHMNRTHEHMSFSYGTMSSTLTYMK